MGRKGFLLDPEIILYRTRVFDEKYQPNNLNELSYPPYAKRQRANVDGEQVFYCSAGYNTAFVESRVKSNQFIILSEWKPLDYLVLNQIGLYPNPEFQEYENFLCEVFTSRNENMYLYSSIVGSHLLKGDTINGLAYPSIASIHEGHNIVLLKECVDNILEFQQAYLYRVDTAQNEEFEYSELAYSRLENNQLVWQQGRLDKFYL